LFFEYSIDDKSTVTDPSGNQLKDLTICVFKRDAAELSGASYVRVSDSFDMRPDLVSIMEYRDSGEGTEMILKYSGISNPFSLCDDDVLRIPDYSMAIANVYTVTSDTNDASSMHEQLIKNYYKFAVTDYDGSPSKSLKALMDTKIPSGNVNKDAVTSGSTPYVNTAGGQAVTIKNGKIYFGDGVATSADQYASAKDVTSDDVNNMISSIVASTSSPFDEMCIFNGTKVAAIERENYKN